MIEPSLATADMFTTPMEDAAEKREVPGAAKTPILTDKGFKWGSEHNPTVAVTERV